MIAMADAREARAASLRLAAMRAVALLGMAGLQRYEVVSDTGAAAPETWTDLGIWLRFVNEAQHGT